MGKKTCKFTICVSLSPFVGTFPLPGSPISDADLLRGCQDGREWSWRELVSRYKNLVYAVCLQHGLTSDDADDAFMETFSKLLMRIDDIQDATRVRAWLVTTARRASIDTLRRDERKTRNLEAMPSPDLPPDPAEELEELENRHLVHRALADLDERCERLLRRLYLTIPRPSYDAVAADLNIPVGSIGPTRARCLKKLRLALVGSEV